LKRIIPLTENWAGGYRMLSYLEVIIQTILAFFGILFITRLLGRKQVSQLTFHEYINGITFGSIAANLATDTDQKTMQHFAGLILFGILTFAISYIAMKKRGFKKMIEGEPVLIIQDGQILEKNLKRLKYDIDEVIGLLRQKNCLSPEDVRYAILEINGQLSVFTKSEKRTITIGDLKLKSEEDSIPTELIVDGEMITENLKKQKLTEKSFLNKLKVKGIKNMEEVMYATVDDKGHLYVDKYDENLDKEIDFSENNGKNKKK